MITTTKLFASALVASQLFIFSPGIVLAQGSKAQEGTALAEFAKNLVEGRSMCMDNYNFNSVQITVDPAKSILDREYLPGETIAIAGTVKNPNGYPLVGGKVYAHILREDALMEADNWHPYVAQEFVPGAYDLSANQALDFQYSYRIPEGSPAGTYRVELYYLVGNRYVMSGIPYVANFTGASAPFTVVRPTSSTATPVQGLNFDRNMVKVNGELLQARQIPPVLEPGKSITVEVPVQKLGIGNISGTVQMDLYTWSVTDGMKPIVSKTVPVTVSTKAAPVTFTWDVALPGTYELVLSATTSDAEAVPSVLNVRFPVAGLTPRIVYSGIGNIADGSATINACVVNATFGSGVGSVTNTLLIDGKEVQTKEAAVSAEQLSTALIMAPLKDLAGKAFDVHVVAKDAAGTVTDETTISYPAGTIAGTGDLLPPLSSPQASDVVNAQPNKRIVWVLVVGLIILAAIAGGIAMMRKRTYPTNS